LSKLFHYSQRPFIKKAQALSFSKCDLVAIGRGLIADPYWPKKVKEGREERTRSSGV